MIVHRHVCKGMLAAFTGAVLLAGCQSRGHHLAHVPPPREESPKLNARQKADLQIAFARSIEKNGTFEQAKAAYEDALRKDPQRADALDRLAVLHARNGRFEQALGFHQKALALRPKEPDFVCNLGYCYYLQQRWAEAEIQFRKALELAPDHRRALNNLGLVLARGERAEEALAAFRRGGCSDADAHSNIAFALTLENSWKEAHKHYARARELDPTSDPAEKGLRIVNAKLNGPSRSDAKAPGKSADKIVVISSQPAARTNVVTPLPQAHPVMVPENGVRGFSTDSDWRPAAPAVPAPMRPPLPALPIDEGIHVIVPDAPNQTPASIEQIRGFPQPTPTSPASLAAPEIQPPPRSLQPPTPSIPKPLEIKQGRAPANLDPAAAAIQQVIGTTRLSDGPQPGSPIEQFIGVTPVPKGASGNR